MNKKIVKKAVGVMLGLSLAVASIGGTASAKSEISGTCDGTTTYGNLSMDSTSATGTTQYARSGASIKVKAIVYYWWGEKYYFTTASNNDSAGGTSATAKKVYGGADVVGAKGEHSVKYGANSWGPKETSLGEIPSNPTEKK